MRKIIASASLAALGAATAHAAYAPSLSPQEQSKPWKLSGALRGFYDDNPTTNYSQTREESVGVEVSPSLAVNLALDQTLIGFDYTYSIRFYAERDDNSADHSHQVNLKVDHAFSELYKVNLTDSFVAAQEQQVIDVGAVTSLLRNNGNNIRNTLRIGLDAELTPVIGLGLAYANSFYNYDESGSGSRSALLDRVEHLGTLDGRWQAYPATVGIFGYKLGMVKHTSNDSLDDNTPPNPFVDPETRDSTSHYVYLGADQTFHAQMNGSVRLGIQFTEYPEALPNQDDSNAGPYADASLQWTYNPGSYLQLGLRHDRNPTDTAFAAGSALTDPPTQDQESTVLYGVINHRITPKMTGSVLGHFQRSVFESGRADGEVDNIFLAGLNLTYHINPFLSAEWSYNYDRLDSDLPGRSFTRNRVYIGLRASY
jgi:hypothetical protein